MWLILAVVDGREIDPGLVIPRLQQSNGLRRSSFGWRHFGRIVGHEFRAKHGFLQSGHTGLQGDIRSIRVHQVFHVAKRRFLGRHQNILIRRILAQMGVWKGAIVSFSRVTGASYYLLVFSSCSLDWNMVKNREIHGAANKRKDGFDSKT